MTKDIVFSTPWFSIEEIRNANNSNKIGENPYYLINIPQGVVILPVTKEGNIVLIRQYRPTLESWTIEIPAGAVDEGEHPDKAASRELYEETGFRCDALSLAGEGVLRVDRENANNFFYLAQGCWRETNFISQENIQTLELPPPEFKQLVVDGKFDHIAALPIIILAQWKFDLDIFSTK